MRHWATQRSSTAVWAGIGCLSLCTLQLYAAPQTPPAAVPLVSPQRVLLEKYCVTCHNQRLKTAGLLLDRTNVDDVGTAPELWEKVARKLRTGQMPPAG